MNQFSITVFGIKKTEPVEEKRKSRLYVGVTCNLKFVTKKTEQ